MNKELLIALTNLSIQKIYTHFNLTREQCTLSGGGAKFYKSNLNLVLQNRASLESFLFTKKVGWGMATPPSGGVGPVGSCENYMVILFRFL